MQKIDVYLEIGKKRVFASAIDWPGWCRSGRDEGSALQAIRDYGIRYSHALGQAQMGFQAPEEVSAFNVIERLNGNATTDFGAPGVAPTIDSRPVDEAELVRLQSILKSLWRAFDEAVGAATGKELRKGPRGGGRELDQVIRHVLEADKGYLGSLGWKRQKQDTPSDPGKGLEQTRQAILTQIAAAARGELPAQGPRGGVYWTPRYFVRRVAWHLLDHAWEIEDRIL